MYSLLLALMYLSFISLGLPDSLLGSAWPTMQGQMAVPLSYAGIITMIISVGTIISSLLSDRLTKKLGAGIVTAASVLLTSIALFGFSISGSFWMLCLWAIPYGLGAGAVDAALNNFVAVHYAPRHMNWLHCFWGVGASISPYIMGYSLTNGLGWDNGYRTVALIQVVLFVIIFASLPLWRQQKNSLQNEEKHAPVLGLSQILRIKGVKDVLVAFFGYCTLEAIAGLWAASYLVFEKGISNETATIAAALFYLGITFGRFVSGFVANKIGNRRMITIGISIQLIGIVAIWLPVSTDWLCLSGLLIIGLGSAPIYPAIIHSTPDNFGANNSQAIIGVQMACAYIGSAFMPLVFGLTTSHFSMSLYPAFLFVFAILLFVMMVRLNQKVSGNRENGGKLGHI